MDKIKQGKKNRAAGSRFELKVRKDIESKGWTISKWGNNVEFPELDEQTKKYNKNAGECAVSSDAKLVPAKHKFRGPGIPMSIGTGFPDFMAFKRIKPETKEDKIKCKYKFHAVIGVEAKSNGSLDKIEKEKCKWLLKNTFDKILIAKKGKKRGEIIYSELKIEKENGI